ncbi:hypothetical protein G7Z17_g13451 [Cylindrodendrum hubeiense]|uniref:Uncharacterized protein n=1 Tax=Cylindrodendrum hubeiense TaxID=595255 RepID=A0A9P5L887_9HYPO|nr:hypothetical protein G7Z17_g13451 [Cylindrodendrum hubeiense]
MSLAPSGTPPYLFDNLEPRQQAWEHNDNVFLALDDDDEIVPDFKPAEGLVDQDVANLLSIASPAEKPQQRNGGGDEDGHGDALGEGHDDAAGGGAQVCRGAE